MEETKTTNSAEPFVVPEPQSMTGSANVEMSQPEKEPEKTDEPVKPVTGILPEVQERIREMARQRLTKAGATDVEKVMAPLPPAPTVSTIGAPTVAPTFVIDSSTGDKRIDDLEKRCSEILKEHRGLEGNIPVHHPYWDLRNAIRNEWSKKNM